MSAFTALNLEPESDSEDELDNSKEIQIEETLKLYQNALRLHSQGPRFHEEAEEAYNALFRSEVFTYLESLSESQRVEYYGEAAEDIISSHDQPVAEPVVVGPSADGAPSTLPQILYLSYKNHGRFILDRLKWRLQQASKQDTSQSVATEGNVRPSKDMTSSLGLFVEALDRDDTDVELWRQVSKIGESLGSTRIARFCLEAVLDRDEVARDAWPEPMGLQELFAAESLKRLLQHLQDGTSESTLPTLTRKQTGFIKAFNTHIDPLPYLPTPPPEPLGATILNQDHYGQTNVRDIDVPLRNWASCGKAILIQLQQEAQGLTQLSPGACYTLDLPSPHLTVNPKSLETSTIPGKGNDRQTGIAVNARNSRKTSCDGKPSDSILEGSRVEQASPQELSKAPTVPEAVDMRHGTEQNADAMHHGVGTVEARRSSDLGVDLQEEQNRTMVLPTRKRSNEAAELDDAEDNVRSRSKRIKARTSIDEPASGREARAKQQLELYQQGELQYFNILDERAYGQLAELGTAFGVATVESVRDRRATIVSLAKALKVSNAGSIGVTTENEKTLSKDLTVLLSKWNSETSHLFLHGGGFEDPISGVGVAQNSGLLAFLEQSGVQAHKCRSKPILADDRGLDTFADNIRKQHPHIDQLAFAWITALLAPNGIQQYAREASTLTAYEAFLWPDNLKETMVQMLVKHDEFIFLTLSDEMASSVKVQTSFAKGVKTTFCSHRNMVQNIFELHLDIYGRITNPSSEVDLPTRTAQLDRLQRWASLAYQVHSFSGADSVSDEVENELTSVRFLWAYAVLTQLCGTCSQDLVIMYFEDLKVTLARLGSPVVELRNNAVMPQISIEATEKQISRLTTMDFFIGVFSPSNNDPVALIEHLEPILEKSIQKYRAGPHALVQEPNVTTNGVGGTLEEHQGVTASPGKNMHMEQMLQFLDKASLPMQLMLWRRLIDAYSIIQYTPRLLWCYLRCIALIVGHLKSSQYLENNEQDRHRLLLRWLKSLDDLLAWTLALAWSDTQSLDCMDEVNLRDALSTLTILQDILHPVMVMDDLFRIGLCDPPTQVNNTASTTYSNSMIRLQDMMVRTWTLRYILTREGAAQTINSTTTMNGALFEGLTSIHRCLGPRNYCKLADKIFLKLARRELSRIGDFADSEIEGAQVILDMYGMKILPGSKEVEDHECPAETLYRSDALEIMDRVLVQVYRFNTKDLIKNDLRLAVEKMQQALRVPKNTATVLHNRRVFSEFLRRPVNPRDLHRALQGIGDLHFQQPHGESFRIAEKGWYFLQGQIALTKYRSQKRVSTGASDELDIALKFFEYDLEQGYEKWETWYRLAQVYDAKIEEETTWTADKLNNHMEELVKLQRSAIHCYTMAVATAERCPDPTFVMFQTVGELYSDFGTRIYASSREPFAMEALSVKNFTKHFNAGRSGTWQGEPFKAITVYGAWRFASKLLRRALVHKSDNWMTWFMLGKCYWKMHCCSENVVSGHDRIEFQFVLDAFKTALEALPERRDSKHPEKDPTLEPHYKLVSVVHKLVLSRRLQVEAACEVLSATPYARKVPPVQDFDDWEGYILAVLKMLRGADKSNWHHRMVVRSARTIYDGSPNDSMATLAAKHELTQQIFTKTMTVQVWKPDNERTGRHFVYTTRYVQFFLRILYEVEDRAGIEALGRQIRKKPGKFFKHTHLWHEMCMTHLKLLRTHSAVPEELSDSAFKNISHDLFVQNADRLEAWAHLPSTELSLIEILKEAVELKKTNANLAKPTAIEDFIADVYAQLHRTIVPGLIARSNEEESRGRMRVDHLMNMENAAASTPSPGPGENAGDAAPTRQRMRGVGRRELQKRAEALVNRPTVQQTATKPPKTPSPANGSTTPRSAIQVVIPQNDQPKENSSVPGSVHDSADDESELSDVEHTPEAATTGALFPNLADSKDGADDEAEEKEGSDEEFERADDERAEEDEEQGEGEGEETYHTPMEM